MKEKNSSIQVVAVEPESSPLISKGYAGAHKIQGIGANFIPENFDKSVCDQVKTVSDEKAFECARLLAKKEGILAGISTGANLAVAIELAKLDENKGKIIVTIVTDMGDRYLSTALY